LRSEVIDDIARWLAQQHAQASKAMNI